MAHATYTTSALVLTSLNTREADRAYWLLTEDLGLVIATAKSVREEVSKLRYALQDLAPVRASLVRGKAGWKLIGAEAVGGAQLPMAAQRVYGRLAALARRLTPPDERCPRIHSVLTTVRSALADDEDNSELYELLAVARMLDELGYLARNAAYTTFVSESDFDAHTIEQVREVNDELLRAVNDAIAESQL